MKNFPYIRNIGLKSKISCPIKNYHVWAQEYGFRSPSQRIWISKAKSGLDIGVLSPTPIVKAWYPWNTEKIRLHCIEWNCLIANNCEIICFSKGKRGRKQILKLWVKIQWTQNKTIVGEKFQNIWLNLLCFNVGRNFYDVGTPYQHEFETLQEINSFLFQNCRQKLLSCCIIESS